MNSAVRRALERVCHDLEMAATSPLPVQLLPVSFTKVQHALAYRAICNMIEFESNLLPALHELLNYNCTAAGRIEAMDAIAASLQNMKGIPCP